MLKKNLVAIFVLLSVILVNLFFGLPRLSKFSSVDEPYWTYDRTSKYWTAIKNRKWKSTNINDKPGITVAIISGAGLLRVDPMPYKSLRGKIKTNEQADYIDKINFSLRLPIYLFCLLMLIPLFLLLRKLLGEKTALFSIIFIGLSPILLGISLIINPDSLLWIFLPLSLVSFILFQKEKSKKYLYLSGFFLGLSLLTKYVSNILYVYFFLLFFLDYIFHPEEKEKLSRYLRQSIINYAILVVISMVTFFAFFPATWVKPEMVLKGTFLSKVFETTWPIFAGLIALIALDMLLLKNKITAFILDYLAKYRKIILATIGSSFLLFVVFSLLNTYLSMKPFDFQDILASPKSGQDKVFSASEFFGNFFADIYTLIFGLTPLVFFTFLLAIGKSIRPKEKLTRQLSVIAYFLLFILLYYFGSTANHIGATVRYQIITYPLAAIIAAIGMSYLSENEKVKKYLPSYVIFPLLILISSISLFATRPFYFSYASTLLPEKYILNLKDMGDGSYEAAQYLNNLPNARELTIWSDKGAVCEAFVGKCVTNFNKKDIENVRFDYFVASTGRKSRSLKMYVGSSFRKSADFEKLYSTEGAAEYKLIIDSRPANFVKVLGGDAVYLEK